MRASLGRTAVGFLGVVTCLSLLVDRLPTAEAAGLAEMLAVLRAERDPGRRTALVPGIAKLGGLGAARALARLTRADPEVQVRVAAARGLGEIEAENIQAVLMAEVRHGGTLRVRAAVRSGDGIWVQL